jgi:NAD-specific glutamate dehydrogenase
MAHSSPYRFDWEETQDAFFSHLQLTREILQLFDRKFNPAPEKRVDKEILEKEYQRLQSIIDEYNTGHVILDETRRIIRLSFRIFRHCQRRISDRHLKKQR